MRKNVLFCYSRLPSFTNTVRDYVQAFGDYSSHRIHYFDMDSGPLDFDLDPFDCLIFNYCFWGRCLSVSPDFRKRVASFPGLKIAILQDEYEYFLWHEKSLIALKIDTIVTCVPEAYWHDVFRDEAFRNVTFINALTGYVPDSLLQLPPPKSLESRPWVIGYRSRSVYFTFGRLTQEKVLIGQRMKQICADRRINANIEVSEESRIYGSAWPEFIGNCRVVLGTESGSNVFDFDGTVKPAIESYLKAHPEADFATVERLFLKDIDGKIKMNQISPRIFEAIAMKTGLVLFEGEYSGVVRPREHYIPLKKDFSNIDEVLATVNDTDKLLAIIECAYREIITSGKYHYQSYIAMLDQHIRQKVPTSKGYEPIYGLIAWRKPRQALQGQPGQNLRLTTDSTLRHTDSIPDPLLHIRLNRGALQRAVMRKYESVLYSHTGRKIHSKLMRNDMTYKFLRKCVRLVTGRI